MVAQFSAQRKAVKRSSREENEDSGEPARDEALPSAAMRLMTRLTPEPEAE